MSERMKTVSDFEDLLALLEKHGVRYLIIGGVAFVFHVKPRYTKDLDVWVDNEPANVMRANRALAEFGSPHLMDVGIKDQIVQVGLPPNRVDLIQSIEGVTFEDAWSRRIRAGYGKASVNWIDLDGLLDIKSRIDDPRHQSDVRYLRKIKEMKRKGPAKKAGKARR